MVHRPGGPFRPHRHMGRSVLIARAVAARREPAMAAGAPMGGSTVILLVAYMMVGTPPAQAPTTVGLGDLAVLWCNRASFAQSLLRLGIHHNRAVGHGHPHAR